MSAPLLNQLDRDIIESILQMGGGYVLDFSDRSFGEFFADFAIQIDDDKYRAQGTSKANRMRVFLRTSAPTLIARVLGGLLERRILKVPGELKDQEVKRYRAIIARLDGGGAESPAQANAAIDVESELLRRIFEPELLARLPFDASLSTALVARMEEAHCCIEHQAFLSAVILCGSVLEGMCLGFGSRAPERVNRAYLAQYSRSAPQFHDWKLREWIEVLGRLGDLSPNVEKFGQALRDFRNYVHPSEQLAHGFSPDQHTARIGFQVVVAAIEDLVRASSVPDTNE